MTVLEALKKSKTGWMVKRPAQTAQNELRPGEEVLMALGSGVEGGGQWLLGVSVVTDRRVFFYADVLRGAPKYFQEIPLQNICTMEMYPWRQGGIGLNTVLEIHALTDTILQVGSQQNVEEMRKVILEAKARLTPPPAPSAAAQPDAAADLEGQLRALKRLLDDGILTDWEYQAKKKQLLGL